ncbi:MAG: NUDIX hydrolase [Deltaproteobacteria bacterium]|nr:NUDIX hydrolase [Deltaproteobacteria bacterium]
MKNDNNKYEFKFCPACGAELKSLVPRRNEPVRNSCAECGFIHYQDPKLVASTIIEADKRIVILRRGIEPEYGRWVFPGGFVDRGETIEFAAKREAEEECGIQIEIDSLLGLYSYPGKTEVVAFFIGRYISGVLAAGDEILEARMINPREIQWDTLAFPSTVDALRDYIKKKNKIRN